MRLTTLMARGIRFRLKSVLAVVSASALTCAVLTGALMSRDSVRDSLDRIVGNRLGNVEFAIETGERFFGVDLSRRISRASGIGSAAVLTAGGSASTPEGTVPVSGVSVLGVGDDFWDLAPSAAGRRIGRGEVLVNRRLAEELDVSAGDTVVVRAGRLESMPGDAPLSYSAGKTVSFRAKVTGILDPGDYGDFSLRSDQVPPLNLFVGYGDLSSMMDLRGRANLFLAAGGESVGEARDLESIVGAAWSFTDAGLEIVTAGDATYFVSDRVFIDPGIAEAAVSLGGSPVLSYFVDSIEADGRSIPYSFVSGVEDPRIPPDLGDDEIVLTRWAADDLEASVGDRVLVEYRFPGTDGVLLSRSHRFTVGAVVDFLESDRGLMPLFPGFRGAADCRDWDPGAPIDVTLIRDRDEEYWDLYGGSPKAFISPATARELWTTRYGSSTAVRFPETGWTGADLDALAAPLLAGLAVRPVREDGLRSSAGGTDFAQLFLGLSVFLLAASLVLTAMLYSLAAESRREEITILSSLGYPAKIIMLLVLAEGAVIAGAGGIVGTGFAILYNRMVIWGLTTVWRDAVRFSGLSQAIRPVTLLFGFLAGWAVSFAALAWTSRRIVSGGPKNVSGGKSKGRSGARKVRRPVFAVTLSIVSFAGTAGILATALVNKGTGNGSMLFFIAGALLLSGSVSAFSAVLSRAGASSRRLTVSALAMKNAARRSARNVSVAAVLAAGIFTATAVGANRTTVGMLGNDERSGTGGFELVVSTSVPLPGLTGASDAYRTEFPDGTRVVGFRLLPGDDASCLNLNRVERPSILGVDPVALRGAFAAVGFADGYGDGADPWSVLESPAAGGAIPAVADATVITWGLGKSIGDTIEYTAESGEKLTVLLAAGLENSIFQGHLIIAEKAFRDLFPSVSGKRFFLVDLPAAGYGDAENLRTGLADGLADFGVEVEHANGRLAMFYSVENAYLAIFMSLGWIGILLGTVGLGIAVYRNVHESRREWAALSALGYGSGKLRKIAALEHLLPAAVGVTAGSITAALSAGSAASGGSGISWTTLAVLTLLLAGFAAAWIMAAVRLGMRGIGPGVLREE